MEGWAKATRGRDGSLLFQKADSPEMQHNVNQLYPMFIPCTSSIDGVANERQNPTDSVIGHRKSFGLQQLSNHSMTLPLTATHQNAGQIAKTTLTTVNNDTNFDFYISGVPDGITLPLLLYTFVNKGSCQQPGPVAYDMNNRITTQRTAEAGWTFYRSAPITVSDLLSGKYSIVVRTTPEDGSTDIFCGDIAQAVR